MDLANAKQVLLDIKVVLNKLRMKFWLVDGIALGAIRDRAIITYDKDMDIRVMAKGFDQSKTISAFENAQFRVRVSHNPALYGDLISGLILYKRGIKVDMCLGYIYPTSTDRSQDLIVVLAGRPVKDISVLPARLFQGSHFIKFLGASFRVPHPPAEYLHLHYGKDWHVPTHAKYPHPSISIQKYVDYFHKEYK